MDNSSAIGLLEQQKDLLRERNLELDEWIAQTSKILREIFPISASRKIKYLKNLKDMPDFFAGYPEKTKNEFYRNMAITHLVSFINELEKNGPEHLTVDGWKK